MIIMKIDENFILYELTDEELEQLKKSIENTTALMKEAAKKLDFIQAAQYRDEIIRLTELLESEK